MKLKELNPKKTFKEMYVQNETLLGTLSQNYQSNSDEAFKASKRFKEGSKEQVILLAISNLFGGLELSTKMIHNNSNAIYAIRELLANYSKVINELDDRIELVVMSLPDDEEWKKIKSQLAEQKPIIDDIRNRIMKKQEELQKNADENASELEKSKENLKKLGSMYG